MSGSTSTFTSTPARHLPWARSTRCLHPLAALLLGWLAAGCAKTDTVVLVHVVDGTGTLTGVYQLKATVSIGGDDRTIMVPEMARALITFPTSFTVEADRSHGGELVVNVE